MVAAGGTVTITVNRAGRPERVLSGIFLGEAGAPPGADGDAARRRATGSARTAPPAMSSPHGTTADLTRMPKVTADASHRPAATSGRRPPPTCGRCRAPTQSTRNAATYYDPNQIKLKLTFPEAYSGNLRLYAVDWDSTGRRETITVNGQTVRPSRATSARAHGSRSRSASRPGDGHDHGHRTAGANAVLSGIFLGNAPTVARAPGAPLDRSERRMKLSSICRSVSR